MHIAVSPGDNSLPNKAQPRMADVKRIEALERRIVGLVDHVNDADHRRQLDLPHGVAVLPAAMEGGRAVRNGRPGGAGERRQARAPGA